MARLVQMLCFCGRLADSRADSDAAATARMSTRAATATTTATTTAATMTATTATASKAASASAADPAVAAHMDGWSSSPAVSALAALATAPASSASASTTPASSLSCASSPPSLSSTARHLLLPADMFRVRSPQTTDNNNNNNSGGLPASSSAAASSSSSRPASTSAPVPASTTDALLLHQQQQQQQQRMSLQQQQLLNKPKRLSWLRIFRSKKPQSPSPPEKPKSPLADSSSPLFPPSAAHKLPNGTVISSSTLSSAEDLAAIPPTAPNADLRLPTKPPSHPPQQQQQQQQQPEPNSKLLSMMHISNKKQSPPAPPVADHLQQQQQQRKPSYEHDSPSPSWAGGSSNPITSVAPPSPPFNNPITSVSPSHNTGANTTVTRARKSSLVGLPSWRSSLTKQPNGTIQRSLAPPHIHSRPPLLSPPLPEDLSRKCLVLDLDETLVHSSFRPVAAADFTIPVELDGQVHDVYVLKRPGVDDFMRRIGPQFEVVVFTASLAKYADPVLDRLDTHKVIKHRLFRESCVNVRGNYVKDLSMLGRDLRSIIIVDNSPASYGFHPSNAIPISTWFNDQRDTELLDLIPFLEGLHKVDNVTTVLGELGDESSSSNTD